MGRVRVKKVFKNPNRFFEFWLANLAKEVRNDSWKMSRIYSKALVSLRKYPIKLNSGKECEILSGFGPSICNILDKKLEEFACENSLSLSEALALGNSLSHSELLRRCIPKVLPCPSSSPVVHSPATVDANALQLGPLLSEGDDSPSYYLIGRSYDIILLMDVRETFGMSKVKELMQTQTIRWEARSLPVGDFVWIAQDVGGPAKCEEIVLGLVIERKRADDLASSIVDGRFMEQKGRMQKLGFRKMYIFEECKSMYNLRISHETLLQAMVNAQLIDECDFVTCTSGEQCVAYLASVTRLLITKSQFNCAVYSDGRRPQESFGGDRLWGIPWTEYLNLGRKSPTLPLREQFGRHLLQIHSITGSKAEDIVGLFPTPKSLFAAYDSLASEDEKKAMLMQSSRSSGLKSINKKTSEIIFHLYNTL
ncbi:crossover junction endonuclease mus81 [Echinococcus multilocularis]|uniref:Crossover junction endonuclease MUS81 n=1 Tax=Echinococcus multilocularis TaxID=6211 RepID=A0A068Y0T8_ECHMU|nr:crossover junction endonuclease mus81 [Echinococcus multilocularis]